MLVINTLGCGSRFQRHEATLPGLGHLTDIMEKTHGVGSLATEYRYRGTNKPDGDLIPVAYAKIAEGYGLKAYTVCTIAELKSAIADSRAQGNAASSALTLRSYLPSG